MLKATFEFKDKESHDIAEAELMEFCVGESDGRYSIANHFEDDQVGQVGMLTFIPAFPGSGPMIKVQSESPRIIGLVSELCLFGQAASKGLDVEVKFHNNRFVGSKFGK